MKFTKTLAATLLIGAGMLSTSAMAAGPWYGALGFGQASCSGCDSQTGYQITGGYQFNPSVSGELTYSDFGKSGGVSSSAVGLYALGNMPIGNNFSLLGKLGATRGEAKGSGVSASNTGLGFGLGGAFTVTPQTDIRLQWERVKFDGGDVNFTSLSATYKF